MGIIYAMNVVFFFNKLHNHISRQEYEQWVHSVDYPTARSIPSIVDYQVARIEGLLESGDRPPYDYVERVVIADLDSYRRDLADAKLDAFKRAWAAHVAESTAVHGTVID
jgi:hypothetical protein